MKTIINLLKPLEILQSPRRRTFASKQGDFKILF